MIESFGTMCLEVISIGIVFFMPQMGVLHLLLQLQVRTSLWHAIWKVIVPLKVKLCVWKLGLPAMISSLLVLIIVLLLQQLSGFRIFSTSCIDSLKLHQGCLESPEYASLIEVAFQASAWLKTYQRAHARPIGLVLRWDGAVLFWMVLSMMIIELEGSEW